MVLYSAPAALCLHLGRDAMAKQRRQNISLELTASFTPTMCAPLLGTLLSLLTCCRR